MIIVGKVDDLVINNLDRNFPRGKIIKSKGLEIQLTNRGSEDLVPLLDDLPHLIKNPKYIGTTTVTQIVLN